jgi:hypothetical protein
MIRPHWIGVLALVAAAWAPPARAEFLVRLPCVTVAVGRPGVVVQVGRPVPVEVGQPLPAPVPVPVREPFTPPPPQGVVPVPPPAPQRALTLEEFAAAFKPIPGTHEVVLLHPGSGQPVPVSFTLPEGCPKVHVHRRQIVFDYGKHEVEVHFRIGGRVQVRYD